MATLWPVPVRALATYDNSVFVASDGRVQHYDVRADGSYLLVVTRDVDFNPDYCIASHSTGSIAVVVASSGAPWRYIAYRTIALELWFESTIERPGRPWAVCDGGVLITERDAQESATSSSSQLFLATPVIPTGIHVHFTGAAAPVLQASTSPIIQVDCTDISSDDTLTANVTVIVSSVVASFIGVLTLADGSCEVVPVGSKPRQEGHYGACFLGDRFIALRPKGRIFCGTAFAPFTVEQTIKLPGLEEGVVSRTSHPNLFTVVAPSFVALCDFAAPAFLHVEHVNAASPLCGACLVGPLLMVWDTNKKCTWINMSSHPAFHSYAPITTSSTGIAGEATDLSPQPSPPREGAGLAPAVPAHAAPAEVVNLPVDGTSFLHRSTDDAPHPSHKKYFRRLSDRLLLNLEVSSSVDGAIVTDYQLGQLRTFIGEIMPSIRLAEVERGRPRTARREGYQVWWQDEWRNRAFELIANTMLLMVRQHRTQPGGPNYDLIYVAEESTRAMPSMLLGNYDAVAVCGEVAAERQAAPSTAFDALDDQPASVSPLLVTAYDLTAITCVSTLRALDCTSSDIVTRMCTYLLSWHRCDAQNTYHDNIRVSRLRERLAADVAALCVDGKLPALTPAAVDNYEKALAKRATKLATEVELALFEMDGRITKLLEPQAALPMVLFYLPYVFAALPSKAIVIAVSHFPLLPVTYIRWALSQPVQHLAARVLIATNPRCGVDESGAHPDVFADYAMLLMQSESERLFERKYPCATLLSALLSLFRLVALPSHLSATGGPNTFGPTTGGGIGGGSINGDGGAAVPTARPTDAFIDERRERQVAMLIDDVITRGAKSLSDDMPTLKHLLIVTNECTYARGIIAFGLVQAAVDHALDINRVDLLWPLFSYQPEGLPVAPRSADPGMPSTLTDADWMYLITASYNKAQLLPAAMLAHQALGDESAKLQMYIALCFPDAENKARLDEQLRKVLDTLTALQQPSRGRS